ncbi:MAG TPA: NADH-quinone oxidoreductase subunit NuoG [Gammaproteobacteria bacterium]|nr:NADH-quinone oxidoreductase subunit NuoG [Gammaproteobacteria bacterium]
MIEIEIDGKKLQVEPGTMIIQAADNAGIYIPRFCYHKKLSIAANCRMCLVEVEKAPKTLPACATPVTPGMKVFTQSEKTIASQKAVMEFLLINHPLDCPICDQGGECELQDLTMGYGKGISRYNQGKRSVKDKNLGPLISSEMTRCIQCTRCVRFGEEIAGLRELGATGRGEQMEIGTYVQHAIRSELSGNIIDICPVGALTSKPFRFTARAWEMRQHAAIAPHDCLGSNIFIHTRGEEYSDVRHVMRVVPRENELINETWLSDRDRFSYEAVNSPLRVTKPLVKYQGQWREVDWETALNAAVTRLRAVIQTSGPENMGALISPSATVEEGYLLQKLLRKVDCHNIDHRIRQADFQKQEQLPHYPTFPLADLETLDSILLVGSDIRFEQPLANHRLRKANKNGATVLCVNPVDYDSNLVISTKLLAGGEHFILALAGILKALLTQSDQIVPSKIASALQSIDPNTEEQSIAAQLLKGQKSAILLGAYAINHPQASLVHELALCIAKLCQGHFVSLTEGANSAGVALAGAVPHYTEAGQKVATPGLNAKQMLEQGLQAYLLLGLEPELDCAYAAFAYNALAKADSVIVLSAFRSQAMENYADVILPIATFAESSGTYVNLEGKWQSMSAATLPMGEARPAWKVVRVLANLLGLSGFDYVTSEQVRDELKLQMERQVHIPDEAWPDLQLPGSRISGLQRIGQWPMYRVDSLVRHAKSLQATILDDVAVIRVNSKLAKELQLLEGVRVTAIQKDSRVSLPLVIDDRIADGMVSIPAGIDACAGFGEALGEVELSAK